MNNKNVPRNCPSCEGELTAERLRCGICGTVVEGVFSFPRLARLSKDDQQFIEVLVLADGSLKTVSAKLGISYPTVRRRLDELVQRLAREVERDRAAAEGKGS